MPENVLAVPRSTRVQASAMQTPAGRRGRLAAIRERQTNRTVISISEVDMPTGEGIVVAGTSGGAGCVDPDRPLDAFAGSGTTGVAARAEGVRCILIEREAEYLEIIRDRLAQQTLFPDGISEAL